MKITGFYLSFILFILAGCGRNPTGPGLAATDTSFEDVTLQDVQDTDLPLMDLHVHLQYAAQSLGDTIAEVYENAAALSKELGVAFGIAEEFGSDDVSLNDSLLYNRLELARKNNLYLSLQVSRRDWPTIFSEQALSQVDYVLGDAMIFPNRQGQMLYIWVRGMPLGEPEEFMDMYVAHHLRVLAEPITILANATYLPDTLMPAYDVLWTDERMKTVIDAAVKNHVAIEINSRFKVPNARFIIMAKEAGARFTFGTNQHGEGVGEIAWSVRMAEICGLTREDFFVPEREL